MKKGPVSWRLVATRCLALAVIVPSAFSVDTAFILIGGALRLSNGPLGPSILDYGPDILFLTSHAAVSILWALALWRLESMRWRWRRFFGVLALLNTTLIMGNLLSRALSTGISFALAGSGPYLASAAYFLLVALLFLVKGGDRRTVSDAP